MNANLGSAIARIGQDMPSAILNSDGEIVWVNDKGIQEIRCDREDLPGTSITQLIANSNFEHGQLFERGISGEIEQLEVEVVLGDGTIGLLECNLSPIKIEGEKHVIVRFQVLKEVETVERGTKADEEIDSDFFDQIDETDLEEIVKNTRVDTPDGEMSLDLIMFDVVTGHKEIEQYKKGALSLHKAIDERLQKEEQTNPGSDECQVLKEVKKAAYGLYLRIQRGDEELHGNRGGMYSGYFE